MVLAKFGLAKCGQIRMAKSGLAKCGHGPLDTWEKELDRQVRRSLPPPDVPSADHACGLHLEIVVTQIAVDKHLGNHLEPHRGGHHTRTSLPEQMRLDVGRTKTSGGLNRLGHVRRMS